MEDNIFHSLINNSQEANFSYESATTEPTKPFNEFPNSRNYDAIVIMFIFLLSIVLNARVCYISLTSERRKKLRPVNILVAHMSLVTISLVFILFLYLVEKWSIMSLTGPGLCQMLSFLRNLLYLVLPLNSVCITYERIKTYQMTLERLLIIRTIFLIWGIALVGSIPGVFMVEYELDLNTNMGKCQQILLFGEISVTIIYEICRFLLFHCFVAGYIIYALFQIRSKLRYLYIVKPIPNPSMQRKVQKIRFVYIHSIVFVILWVPCGLHQSVYKIWTRTNIFTHYSIKTIHYLGTFLNFTLIILSPLIYAFLNENISFRQFCLGKSTFTNCNLRSKRGLTRISEDGVEVKVDLDPDTGANVEHKLQLEALKTTSICNAKNKNRHKMEKVCSQMDLSEMSRVSTVKPTSSLDTVAIFLESSKNIVVQNDTSNMVELQKSDSSGIYNLSELECVEQSFSNRSITLKIKYKQETMV